MRTSPDRTKVLTATEASILGLLTDGELAGYDLVKAIAGSVGYLWAPAKSQLYSVLPRLVESGLASARVVRQSSRPDKQLYRITDAGRAALHDWINTRAPTEPDRNPLLLQLFFGENGDPAALLEHVRARRRELEELEASLTEIDAHPARTAEHDFFPALTRRYGHAYARALVDWARETERDLEQRVSDER